MHDYTETKSKYTGKIGTYSMYEQMYITLELKIQGSHFSGMTKFPDFSLTFPVFFFHFPVFF